MRPGRLVRLLAAIGLASAMASSVWPVAAAIDCPVTIPNGSRLPPGGGSFTGLEGRPSPSHGNGQLWVAYLTPNGVVAVREDYVKPDGSMTLKFAWARRIVEYRTVDGALTGIFAGELEIETRRLDAPAPPARVSTNPTGVHVGSSITFPTAGCWEVTGRAGADSLTFVFLLGIEGQPLPSTATEPPGPPFLAWGLVLLVASLASAVARLRGSRSAC